MDKTDEAVAWEAMMARVMAQAEAEAADYSPGTVTPPGSGTEGDDPLGTKYADLGHLAFVVNEALDSAVTRGADRDALVQSIADSGSEDVTLALVEGVLSGKVLCPPMAVLQAFGDGLSIDTSIIIDAAQKGGCKNLGPISYPPE